MNRDALIRGARGLGAFVALAALVFGVPAGLAAIAGWPLPRALPSLEAIRQALTEGWFPEAEVVLKAVAVVCWAAWAELVACAVVEVRACLRGRRAPRVPLAGPLQTLVANLVATVVLATTPGGTGGGPGLHPPLAALVHPQRLQCRACMWSRKPSSSRAVLARPWSPRPRLRPRLRSRS